MTPLLTIGLPFYNDRQTLEMALKSIFVQTCQDWELIIVDDGSTDGSSKIAESLADSRVKLIKDGDNRGLIFRLNQITTLARGKFIARMDADDMMDPERLQKQLAYLLANPDVDVVDTGTYSIDQNNTPIGKRGLDDINRDAKEVLKHTMLLHASIMGKKSWFLENPYDEDYIRAEDYELWCRTHTKSIFARIKEPLYIVREGKVNVSNYAMSSKTIRKIFRNYSSGVLSPVETQIELIKSKGKVFAYKTFALFDKQDILSKSRNVPLSIDEINAVNKIIERIRDQKLYSEKK